MGSAPPLTDPAFPLLRRAAGDAGARAWVVGGYVRDHLLGRPQPDLDVVVEGGLGLEVATAFAAAAGAPPPVTFPAFGTAQVKWGPGDRIVEFASARSESYPSDSRKPEVRPATLEEDVRRRDFTVNALLMDLDGRVVDVLGRGLRDLEARVLRTPLDPDATFADDPLRMLRAARFAAQLGFDVDPLAAAAIERMRERARPPVLSVERVHDELVKLLVAPEPGRGLRLLDGTRLLDVVLPEVAACRGVEQGGYHTFDVLGHTIRAVELSPPESLRRTAALMHDVGKPATATPDGAFHGHERVGAEIASTAMRRLRFSNLDVERVARLVRLHLRPVFYEPTWTDAAVRRLARDAGDLLDALLDLARADVAASAYPDAAKVEELAARLAAVRAESPTRLRPPVDGEDVMAVLGIGPGPQVGKVLERVADLVLDGTLEPDRDAVLGYMDRHRSGLLAG